MTYPAYVDNSPVFSETGSVIVGNTKINLEALRDALMIGMMPGWTMSVYPQLSTFGAQPSILYWKRGVLWVKGEITWGTTGGELYNPKTIVYSFSGNSGVNWDVIGTATFSYWSTGPADAIGACHNVAWS